MKKIAFIVDGYYPQFSAIGVCIANIVHELEYSHDITVVAKKSKPEVDVIQHKNHRIAWYSTFENNWRITNKTRLRSSKQLAKVKWVSHAHFDGHQTVIV